MIVKRYYFNKVGATGSCAGLGSVSYSSVKDCSAEGGAEDLTAEGAEGRRGRGCSAPSLRQGAGRAGGCSAHRPTKTPATG